MTEWLLELFSGDDAKVRLVLIGVSTLAAALVVLMNQGFNNRRQRKALKVDKLEALHESASKFEAVVWDSFYTMNLYREHIEHRHKLIAQLKIMKDRGPRDEENCERAIKECTLALKELLKEIYINFTELRASYQRVVMLRNLYFSKINFDKWSCNDIEGKFSAFRKHSSEEHYIDDLKNIAQFLEGFALEIKMSCANIS